MELRFEFPFERAAMRGEMPENDTLLNTGGCWKLGQIYREFNAADRTPEARQHCQRKKAELRREWEFDARLTAHHAAVTKATEILKAKVRKNPTPENAILLCDALDGLLKNPEIVRLLEQCGVRP